MIEYQHHWFQCLWMLSPFTHKGQTEEDIIVHWKNLKDSRLIVQLSSPRLDLPDCASFAILQQIRNSTGWSVKLTSQLVFQASIQSCSIQFFVILDTAFQTQHITSHLAKVPFILMVQSSVLVFGYFHLFRQNESENAYGRESRNLLCHLEQQVAHKSWQVHPG